MAKHINVLEKDLEILSRKHELLQMENMSLKSKVEIYTAERKNSTFSKYPTSMEFFRDRQGPDYYRDENRGYTSCSIDSPTMR